MKKYRSAILDADFAIKVGTTSVINVIGDVLPLFCEKLYIHRHVFENEILFPALVKYRIQELLNRNLVEIVDRESIEQKGDLLAVAVYDSTVELLRTADEITRSGGKNWGEVVSLSLAKALNFPVFLSDEAGLQKLVDDYLNLGDKPHDERNIQVVRVDGLVVWMRDNGFSRKHGKVLWSAAGKPRDMFDPIWSPGVHLDSDT